MRDEWKWCDVSLLPSIFCFVEALVRSCKPGRLSSLYQYILQALVNFFPMKNSAL